VHRLLNEHSSYKDEIVQLQLKHDRLLAEGAEEWDVKNAVCIYLQVAGGGDRLTRLPGADGGRVAPDGGGRGRAPGRERAGPPGADRASSPPHLCIIH
jgi:hypothetical protein